MSEETGLINTFNPTDLAPKDEDGFLKQLANKTSFLPSLKLFASQAAAVTQDKIAKAHYGIQRSKDDIIDLGKTPDVIFYARRYKAVEKVGGEYFSYYNHKSENFARAKEKSEDRNSGSMCGIEFLVWVPSEKTFCGFYANNTSTLQIADKIIAMFGKAVTLGSKPVQWKTYNWYAPTIIACATDLELPDTNELQVVGNKFVNPKEADREVDTEADKNEDRR